MAQKCVVLGLLIVIHSLGLIFASLFIHKWYVSDTLDVGIFGICQYKYFNTTNPTSQPERFFTCYQLLWPDSDYTKEYIAGKPAFLNGLMGVAIASTALGFLTVLWALLSIYFSSIGEHPKASGLLLILTILTDMAVITTFGMFLGKDDELYPFENYGVSFWCSVGAACGFLLASVIFAVNCINSGFTYKLKYYDNELIDT